MITICVAALAASLGAALLATAQPFEERPCAAGELRMERVFALETSEEEGAGRASHFVELGHAQLRPQVFTLRFEAEGVEEARSGRRAISLPGHQTLPMILGTEALAPGEAMRPEAIAQAIQLHCRSW